MKIAAVIVPITLLILPLLALLLLALRYGLRGKDLSQALIWTESKMGLLVWYSYLLVFYLSIGWAFYVYTRKIESLVFWGILFVCVLARRLFLARLFPKLYKLPPKIFLDDKAKLVWENKITDDLGRNTFLYLRFGVVYILSYVLIIAIAFAITSLI